MQSGTSVWPKYCQNLSWPNRAMARWITARGIGEAP